MENASYRATLKLRGQKDATVRLEDPMNTMWMKVGARRHSDHIAVGMRFWCAGLAFGAVMLGSAGKVFYVPSGCQE